MWIWPRLCHTCGQRGVKFTVTPDPLCLGTAGYFCLFVYFNYYLIVEGSNFFPSLRVSVILGGIFGAELRRAGWVVEAEPPGAEALKMEEADSYRLSVTGNLSKGRRLAFSWKGLPAAHLSGKTGCIFKKRCGSAKIMCAAPGASARSRSPRVAGSQPGHELMDGREDSE